MSTTLTGGLGLRQTAITDTVSQMVEDMAHNVAIVDKIYPVGSIYMSTSPNNPADWLGGSWQRIEGRFLVGVDGSAYPARATGGRTDMGMHKNGDEPTQESVARQGGLTATNRVGFEGRVMVAEDGYTGKLVPPYYAVYIWERTA